MLNKVLNHSYKFYLDVFIAIPNQARRHGRYFGAMPSQITASAPPKQELCPSKRGLCPEEINKLGATGVQFEA